MNSSLDKDARLKQVGARLAEVRRELESLGFEATVFFRSPGSAKDPVAYLLVGESFKDIEEARKALSA
ncbi:hypothetical protein [Achromobacter insuavis]|uniref:hypothetical protein n=1 Tax=Achromobacter insuavis TaxID=1287735 RepID=UPI001F13D069|nr:hypothetical protein [Achromobacter insuavis]